MRDLSRRLLCVTCSLLACGTSPRDSPLTRTALREGIAAETTGMRVLPNGVALLTVLPERGPSRLIVACRGRAMAAVIWTGDPAASLTTFGGGVPDLNSGLITLRTPDDAVRLEPQRLLTMFHDSARLTVSIPTPGVITEARSDRFPLDSAARWLPALRRRCSW